MVPIKFSQHHSNPKKGGKKKSLGLAITYRFWNFCIKCIQWVS